MDDIFGGGSDNQTVTQKVQLPGYVEKGGENIFKAGAEMAGRPRPTYDGPRIAGFSPETLAAFEKAGVNVDSWMPYFQESADMTRGAAAPVGETDIARYMNPYMDQVVSSVVDEMTRARGRDRIASNSNMAKRGSYLNEDRRAAIDNLANEAFYRSLGSTVGGLKASGFNTALGQANTDKARGMTGGGSMASLAALLPELQGIDIQNLAGVGATKEGKTQSSYDLAYKDFLDQFNYPQEQLDWLMALLQGTPMGRTQTTTQPVGTNNTFAQILGALGAGAGAAGNFGLFK